MPRNTPFPDVRSLSLRARAAVALIIFEDYSRARGLQHPEIEAFKDHLWWFVGTAVDDDSFEGWRSGGPPLVEVGLGDEYPAGFGTFLASRGVDEREVRRALSSTTEVLYGSFYAAADDAGSRMDLEELWGVAEPLGVPCPAPDRFDGSRWADCAGWGLLPSPEVLARWRLGEQGQLLERLG